MFITYDLQQAPEANQPSADPRLRGAKEFQIHGPLLKWEVGTFENPSGVNIYGVKVNYRDHDPGGALRTTLIQVPANARNVTLREELPAEYRTALDSAA